MNFCYLSTSGDYTTSLFYLQLFLNKNTDPAKQKSTSFLGTQWESCPYHFGTRPEAQRLQLHGDEMRAGRIPTTFVKGLAPTGNSRNMNKTNQKPTNSSQIILDDGILACVFLNPIDIFKQYVFL